MDIQNSLSVHFLSKSRSGQVTMDDCNGQLSPSDPATYVFSNFLEPTILVLEVDPLQWLVAVRIYLVLNSITILSIEYH